MADEKAAPLPLSAEKTHAPATDSPFLPSVRQVIMWVLIHAGGFAVSIALGLIVTSISHPPSWLLPRRAAEPEEDVTDAEAYAFVMAAMLWCVCVVSQAIAGALALALPRRHRLRLAYAALVATAAGHCLWAGLYITMCVAPGGGLSFSDGVNAVVIVVSGVGDLLCFRGLVLRGGEEEY